MIGWFLGRPGSLRTGASSLQAIDRDYGCEGNDPPSPIGSFDQQEVADIPQSVGSSAPPTAAPVISLPMSICETSLQLRKLCSVVVSIKMSNDVSFSHIPRQMTGSLLLYDLKNALSRLLNSKQVTTMVTLTSDIHQAKLTLRGSPELVSACINELNLQVKNESSLLRTGLLSSHASFINVILYEEEKSIDVWSSLGRSDVQAICFGIFVVVVAIIFRRRIVAYVTHFRAGNPRRNN